MRIYVGTYGKYASGSLEGDWLDLDDYSSKADFIKACLELHSDESDPELMFQDYDADESWESQFYSESSINEDYWEAKKQVKESGIDGDALGEYLEQSYNNTDVQSAIDNFRGIYDSVEDFAIEVAEESGVNFDELPSFIRDSIDYKEMARQLSFEFEYIKTKDYKTAIFHNS